MTPLGPLLVFLVLQLCDFAAQQWGQARVKGPLLAVMCLCPRVFTLGSTDHICLGGAFPLCCSGRGGGAQENPYSCGTIFLNVKAQFSSEQISPSNPLEV